MIPMLPGMRTIFSFVLFIGAGSQSLASDAEYFEFDTGVRDNFSVAAADFSYYPLYFANIVPVVAIMTSAESPGRKQRGLAVYGMAAATNFGLTHAVKYAFRRPRPYTHNDDPAALAFARTRGDDNTLSFYSGHSSVSFVAATAGSMISGATIADRGIRRAFWATEFGMASSAAVLRVRAGKHYYTDIAVGALAGILVGAGFASELYEVEPDSIGHQEIVSALAGSALGCLTYFLPFEDSEGSLSTSLRMAPIISADRFGISASLSI